MMERVKTYLRYIIFVFALVLLGFLLRDYLKSLSQYKFEVRFGYLLLSFFLLSCATLLLPTTWFFITKLLGCELSFLRSVRLRLISEIGKYMPGRVLGYGYLVIQYKKSEKDTIRVLNSSIYEIYLCTISSFIFFTLVHLFTSYELLDPYRPLFILSSLLGLLSLHPWFFQIVSNLICKLFKRESIKYRISFKNAIVILFMYLVYWVIISIAFFFLVRSFSQLTVVDINYFAGAYAISSFSGFLAFFLPAGLGAREAMLIYLLSNLLGNALGVVVSLSSRIWIIVVDFVFFMLSLVGNYLTDRRV